MRKLVVGALVLLASSAVAHAKCESLEGADLGTHWYGPKQTLESLKGHVVLWENWGYN